MPAPTVSEEIARFDPALPLAEAATPPSTWYTLPAIHALEKESVFQENWIIAARAGQLGRPGSYVTGEIAGERYVVVRDEEGELRAFVNLCRHRATAVASGCGRAEKFVCPYHGWTYGLDGKLLGAPELGGIKGFVKESSGLIPLRVVQWGPLVFVSRGTTPGDLIDELGPLAGILAPSGYDTICFVTRQTWELNCNWKVFVDNYLDGGYHVPFLHKGLASQLDLDSYRTEIFDRFSVQSTSGSGSGKAGAVSPSGGGDFAERIGAGAIYAWIYPTLMINRYGPVMDTNWVIPLGPDRTRVHMDYYFEESEGDGAAEFIQRSLDASRVVQEEDVSICESVQQGLSSTSFSSGRYSLKRQAGEHHFHRLLAADLRLPEQAGGNP